MPHPLRFSRLAIPLLVISAIASYTANYAMIYRLAASGMSLIGLIFSAAGILGLYRAREDNKRKTGLLTALAGTAIYSLHKPWTMLFLLLLIFRHSRPLQVLMQKLPDTEPRYTKAKWTVLTCLLILINDFSREYSVWHRAEWNLLPLLLFAGSLLWLLLERRQSGFDH